MEVNKKNVISSINTIERAAKAGHFLDMTKWQKRFHGRYKEILGELLNCGTPACFAGLVAASEDFHKDGGRVGDVGQPVIDVDGDIKTGHWAIAHWMGIIVEDSLELCAAHGREWYGLCGKQVSDITHQDVLSVLCRLRDTGSIWKQEIDQ